MGATGSYTRASKVLACQPTRALGRALLVRRPATFSHVHRLTSPDQQMPDWLLLLLLLLLLDIHRRPRSRPLRRPFWRRLRSCGNSDTSRWQRQHDSRTTRWPEPPWTRGTRY
jgi:hypothetical protein